MVKANIDDCFQPEDPSSGTGTGTFIRRQGLHCRSLQEWTGYSASIRLYLGQNNIWNKGQEMTLLRFPVQSIGKLVTQMSTRGTRERGQ